MTFFGFKAIMLLVIALLVYVTYRNVMANRLRVKELSPEWAKRKALLEKIYGILLSIVALGFLNSVPFLSGFIDPLMKTLGLAIQKFDTVFELVTTAGLIVFEFWGYWKKDGGLDEGAQVQLKKYSV